VGVEFDNEMIDDWLSSGMSVVAFFGCERAFVIVALALKFLGLRVGRSASG